MFIIYSICLTVNCLTEIKNTYKIKNIYENKLKIDDTELEYIEWNYVVERLKTTYDDPNLNIYTINARILKKENIMVFLYKNKVDYLPSSSRFLEWNFVFCFLEPLFDNNNEILEVNLITDRLKEKIKTRCRLVFFINLITLPFMIYVILIYFIIKYGEIFYHNPEDSISKIWSTKGFWKLRYYNELKHQYNRRNHKIKEICQDINQYYGNLEVKEIILRFVNFVLGSFFVLLVLLSVLNELILTDGIVFSNRTTLWVMTLMGTILAVNKKFIHISSSKKYKYYKPDEDLFEKLKDAIPFINPLFFEFKNRKKLNHVLSQLYHTKIYYIMLEFINICISPIYIYKLYKNIDDYIDLLVNNIQSHYILDLVINRSILTNVTYLKNSPHCYYSYTNFLENNPEWKKNILNFNELSNTINEMEYKWDNKNLEQNSFTMLHSYY
jgi:hypothetical protein